MITHYEVYVTEFGPPIPLFGVRNDVVISQISPEQTEVAAREAGVDLQAVYGSVAGRKCVLHQCYHDPEGKADGPCTEETLWQS